MSFQRRILVFSFILFGWYRRSVNLGRVDNNRAIFTAVSRVTLCVFLVDGLTMPSCGPPRRLRFPTDGRDALLVPVIPNCRAASAPLWADYRPRRFQVARPLTLPLVSYEQLHWIPSPPFLPSCTSPSSPSYKLPSVSRCTRGSTRD